MKPALTVSFPHIRRSLTSRDIMTDVLIAAIPPLLGSVWNFGWRALALVAFSAAVCAACDRLGAALRRQKAADNSGLVTGVLLALCLPVGTPFWAVALAGAFAVLVAKQLCGGIGRNLFNPAMAGRALLMLAFPQTLTGYARVDALSGATPLSQLETGSRLSMLFGFENGSLGETSAILILLGGFYLYLRGWISLRTPLFCLGAFTLGIWLLGGALPLTGAVIPHLLSGGLLLAAFFYVTDFTTKPTTPAGEALFAAGVGILTAVLRLWGRYPEGVCFAILLMNLAAPLLEYATRRRVYGISRKKEIHT